MKHIHCPANAWDCPYYQDVAIFYSEDGLIKEYCLCGMPNEGLNPMEECSDFYYFYEDCTEEEYTDDTDYQL